MRGPTRREWNGAKGQAILQTKEFARELEEKFGEKVSVSTIYNWIRRRRIDHIHVGRKLKISREVVQQILSRGIEIE